MEDTPEARMKRIRELLLNNRPKQVVMANVRSPQEKLAKRLGLGERHEERGVSPQRVHHHPTPLPVPTPGRGSSGQGVPIVDNNSMQEAENNMRTMMLSIKMQNDHLRGALNRASQELVHLRGVMFNVLESDQFKDRRYLEEQEQHYWDYIMVEHAVGEREEVWKGIVRDLEERRHKEVTELLAALEEKERKRGPVYSPPNPGPPPPPPPPVVHQPPPPQPQPPGIDPGIKKIVAELRDELTSLRRQHNNDKAVHARERGLWSSERNDLLAALEYHKQALAKRGTGGHLLSIGEGSQPQRQIAYSTMEQQVRAREKKRARAQHMREKEDFMERVKAGKEESDARNKVELLEDDERKKAAVAFQSGLEARQAPHPGYNHVFAHQREVHANIDMAADLSSLLSTQLKEITSGGRGGGSAGGASRDFDDFDTDIL
eukprot:TRINITY_DN9062_c0_g1_i1.p1 TRINITY_DN9062_c0_g1~~TRINITY_DN9062_c0_g1_i1.p1  ORF type:complete len:456 (+),score=101.21 TRINITY_DN9062_c0_g1_i1:74-1369(+)